MSFNRITKTITQSKWNENIDKLERAGIYIFGKGILTGLELSIANTPADLELAVSAGVMYATSAEELIETSTLLNDDAVKFVWIDEESNFVFTDTDADPGDTFVCLGKVTTSGGEITDISDEGRVLLLRWVDLRTAKLGNDLIIFDLVQNLVSVSKLESNLVILPHQAGTPDAVLDKGILYTKDVGGDSGLYIKTSDDNEVEIVSGGLVNVTPHAAEHLLGGNDAIGFSTSINMAGTIAARPAAAATNNGYFYYATDTLEFFRSNGTDWILVAIGKSFDVWRIQRGAGTTAQAQNTTIYYSPKGGWLATETSEANVKLKMPKPGRIYGFRAAVSSVGGSGQTATLKLRKNEANTDIQVVWNSGESGEKTDDDIVAFAANDFINYQMITSATTGSVGLIYVEIVVELYA